MYRRKFFLSIVLSAFSVGFGFAQMEIKNERVFTGTALYGFMNGGADLYYEYGFQELISREIAYKGEDFTVDTYTMDTPLNAFGIYSILTYKCIRADSLGCFDCLSKYQLQAVDGNAYVSIVFQSGSNAARKSADELYRMLVNDGKNSIRIPGQFMYLVNSYSGTLKYMRGKLGINNVEPALLDLLEDIGHYEIWLAETSENKDRLALFFLQDSKNCNLLQKRIPKEKIIRRGEKFVMIKL